MASNYVSLYGAVNKNGKPIDFKNSPLLEDIPAENIVYVQLSSCLNISGQLVPAFLLFLSNPGGLTYSTVYLYTYPGFTTIQQFANGLGLLGTSVPFTIYTNLLSIDYKPVITSGQSVLINDNYVVPGGRKLSTQGGTSTYVTLKWANNLIKQKWQFAGNQTFAGNYTYFYV